MYLPEMWSYFSIKDTDAHAHTVLKIRVSALPITLNTKIGMYVI